MHCVDLGESFPTHMYLQKSASIQPRTSTSKFGGKFNSFFICLLRYVKQGVDLSLQPLWSMTEKEDELFQWSPLDEKHAVSKWNKQPAIPEVKKSGFTFMS